jgi:hypothetical protein
VQSWREFNKSIDISFEMQLLFDADNMNAQMHGSSPFSLTNATKMQDGDGDDDDNDAPAARYLVAVVVEFEKAAATAAVRKTGEKHVSWDESVVSRACDCGGCTQCNSCCKRFATDKCSTCGDRTCAPCMYNPSTLECRYCARK